VLKKALAVATLVLLSSLVQALTACSYGGASQPLTLTPSSNLQPGSLPWWATATDITWTAWYAPWYFQHNITGIGRLIDRFGIEYAEGLGGNMPTYGGLLPSNIDEVHMKGAYVGTAGNDYIPMGESGAFLQYYNSLQAQAKWKFPNGTTITNPITAGSGRTFDGCLVSAGPIWSGEVDMDPSNPYWGETVTNQILEVVKAGNDGIYLDNLVVSPLDRLGDFGFPGSWFDYNFNHFLASKYTSAQLASMGIDLANFRFASYLGSRYQVTQATPCGAVTFSHPEKVRGDPIVKDWLFFQYKIHTDFVHMLYTSIKEYSASLGKQVIFYGNMGAYWNSYEALSLLANQDVVSLESWRELGFYPPDGSPLLDVKTALAATNYSKPVWVFEDYPPTAYPWLHLYPAPGGLLNGSLPANLSYLFQLQQASAFAAGGVHYLDFTTGYSGSLASVRMLEGSESYAILPYVSLAKEAKGLLLDPQPSARIAIVSSQPTWYWNHIPPFELGYTPADVHYNEVLGWANLLESHHLPYDVIIFGQPGFFNDSQQLARLGQYDLVVLPNVEVLSNAQIQALQEYVAHGGRLIISGDFGEYDTNYDLRSSDDAGLRKITSSSQWILEPIGAEYWIDLINGADVSAVESRMSSVLKSSLVSPQLETNAPPRVLVNVMSQPSMGRQLIHVVNMQYGANLTRDWVTDVANVTVSLKTDPNLLARGVFLVTPESNEPIPLSVTQEGGYARLTIPHLHVWAIVVIGMPLSDYDVMRDAGHVLFTQLPPLLASSGATAAVGSTVNSATLSYWNGDYDQALRLGTEAFQEIATQAAKTLALHDQASQILASLGSNITAIERTPLQSSEAKNLLNQSLDQYRLAEQSFQSKDYPGTIQHAQKALDLIHQAHSTENQYQQQQKELLTRTSEIIAAVVVAVMAAGALAIYLRKRRRSTSH
jgi:hypothetical protein